MIEGLIAARVVSIVSNAHTFREATMLATPSMAIAKPRISRVR